MMSAEYDRLMEAWVAGRLTDEEEGELFRLAEQKGEGAKLLERKSPADALLDADRELLAKGYDAASLRARVEALSKMTGSAEVEGLRESAGAAKGVPGISGAVRWIGGVLLIGGAAVGIYLGIGSASSEQGPGEPANRPAVTAAPASESKGQALPLPDAKADEPGQSVPPSSGLRENAGPEKTDPSLSGKKDAPSSSTSSSTSSTEKKKEVEIGKRSKDSIRMKTSIDDSDLP